MFSTKLLTRNSAAIVGYSALADIDSLPPSHRFGENTFAGYRVMKTPAETAIAARGSASRPPAAPGVSSLPFSLRGRWLEGEEKLDLVVFLRTH
jgi:hypothetical protein